MNKKEIHELKLSIRRELKDLQKHLHVVKDEQVLLDLQKELLSQKAKISQGFMEEYKDLLNLPNS